MSNIRMKSIGLTAAAGAAVAGLLAFIAPMAEAQTAQCREHYHVVYGPTAHAAISNWQRAAGNHDGQPSQSFYRACNRQVIKANEGWFALGRPYFDSSQRMLPGS
jgi:hypothetical protein